MSPPCVTFTDRFAASVKAHASLPLFKVPKVSPSDTPTKWTSITYEEYWNDVEHVARHLAVQLGLQNIAKGSIVGLWLGGWKYDDYVYVVALGRAGYIPQLFSLFFTFPGLVFDLLKKSGASALVHDQTLTSALGELPVPVIPALTLQEIPVDLSSSSIDPSENLHADENSTALICHTSGSTSGIPKLVPFSHRFIPVTARKMAALWSEGHKITGHFTSPYLGSISHAPTMHQYLGLVELGGCMVFPSSVKFSPEELLNVVRGCGINTLLCFAPLAEVALKEAQINPTVLKLLQGLSSFAYGGVQMSEELIDWAYESNIPLINMYASTECGILMTSTIDRPSRFLKPMPGMNHRFEPVDGNPLPEDKNTEKLYELVILPDSPDIPSPTLVGSDGCYRTGDLFERAKGLPGMWTFRGRGDDWIKNDVTQKCDPRAIEEKVRETCREIVRDCVVVGNARPCLAILVEPTKSSLSAEQRKELQEEIIRRTSDFSARRLLHERITDPRFVYVLDGELLPRTAKGNIRRKATEEQFKAQLSAIYAPAA